MYDSLGTRHAVVVCLAAFAAVAHATRTFAALSNIKLRRDEGASAVWSRTSNSFESRQGFGNLLRLYFRVFTAANRAKRHELLKL